jgi:hypothetical protein
LHALLQRVPVDVRRVLAVGALSALGYVLVYLSQQALFLNGLPQAGNGSQARVAGVAVPGMARDAAQLNWQLAAYYGGTLLLFGSYAWLLLTVRRGSLGAAAARVALALPVLFYLVMLFAQPTLSRDVYSYVAQGYIAAELGGNPYLMPASAIADTPLGRELLSAGWLLWHGVTPYGPIWTLYEALVLRLTTDLAPAIFLLKALVVAASLGSAALIWRILGAIAPDARLLGTAAYLWNPLIIFEIAGDGHNDGLMVVCVLAGLLAAVRLRPGWSVLWLVLGGLVKYLPLIFLPAVLVYLVRQGRAGRRVLAGAALGALAGGLIAAFAVGVFWTGGPPYQGIPEGGQRGVAASLSGAMIWVLSRLLPQSASAWLVALSLNAIAAAYVLVRSWGVRESARLVEVCATSAVFYVLVASPLIWPRYAALPVALLALSPRGTFAPLLVILPLCLRLVAPLPVLYENHFITWPVSAAGMIFAATAALLAFLYLHGRRPGRRAAILPGAYYPATGDSAPPA